MVAKAERPSESAKSWKLVSSEEATPLKLEEPNTTMALSASESEWFRKVHIEVIKGSGRRNPAKAPARPLAPKSRPR
jgi:hypothetical protein